MIFGSLGMELDLFYVTLIVLLCCWADDGDAPSPAWSVQIAMTF